MEDKNPRISRLLYWVTLVESIVLLVVGLGLLLFPSLVTPQWPWPLTPFNAVLLAAVYSSSLMATALTVYIGRWAPARVVMPMIFLFTTVVLIASLVNLNRFDFTRFGSWAWFLLYIVIPVNAAYWMWLTRRLKPYSPFPVAAPWRTILLVPIIILGGYGIGLLLAPDAFSSFWPWPIDAFHGRVYSVLYLTPALGGLLLWRAAAAIEMLTLGLVLAVGGLVAIVGAAVVDLGIGKVDWAAVGTWAWVATFLVLFLSGSGLIYRSRVQEQPREA